MRTVSFKQGPIKSVGLAVLFFTGVVIVYKLCCTGERESFEARGVRTDKPFPPPRDLPETRPVQCDDYTLSYNVKKPPSVSVVIHVRSESKNLLDKAIRSVLARSPGDVLLEVVVLYHHVDPSMEQYINKEGAKLPKVRVVEIKRKTEMTLKTLITAASKVVIGDIVVFLEADVECNKNWLEPLVSEITKDTKTIAIPVADNIDNAMQYIKVQNPNKIVFTWDMQLAAFEAPFAELAKNGKTEADPLKTPAMTGALFALHKNSLQDINKVPFEGSLELSIFLWECGWKMQLVPCSRVGQMNAYDMSRMPSQNNVKLIASNWLENYQNTFQSANHKTKEPLQKPDIDVQNIKEKLSCKSFNWYMNNVVDAVLHPPEAAVNFGVFQSGGGGKCFSAHVNKHLEGVDDCYPMTESGIFWMDKSGRIHQKDQCVTAEGQTYVSMADCDPSDNSQKWIYTENRQLKTSDGSYCLMHNTDPDSDKGVQVLMAQKCVENDTFQQFKFTHNFS